MADEPTIRTVRPPAPEDSTRIRAPGAPAGDAGDATLVSARPAPVADATRIAPAGASAAGAIRPGWTPFDAPA
jgi:hypothetical protein